MIEPRKIIPATTSIQLAKSFNCPRKAFTSNKTPKKINSPLGMLIPVPNIKIIPAIRSNAPNPLTNMFFKPNYSLKICACSSAWIERFPPKEEVEGSNPSRRVLAKTLLKYSGRTRMKDF